MKKILSVLLLISCLSLKGLSRDFTYTYEGQTITYTVLDEEARTCETKQGEGLESGNIVSGRLDLPEHPMDGTTQFTLTVIGTNSFRECSGLTSVTIPRSVTSIGQLVFYRCSGLEEVFFNAENCTECKYNAFPPTLQRVTFGEKVKIIPGGLFYGCTGITSVTIPDSVTSIGNNAFTGCSITSVTIPNSVTSIGGRVFGRSLEEVFFNAENCTECGDSYSYSSPFDSALKRVTFGDKVKIIPGKLFCGCSGLTSVTIPNSVTSIGDYAFFDCSFTSVTIPNSVTYIGSSAFEHCSSLTSVTIPNSVTSIGKYAFLECNNLDIVFASGIESWLKIKFEDVNSNPTRYAKKLLVGGESIRRLTIPEGTTRINAYAFVNCEPLVTVNLPASLSSIGEKAFAGCSGLQRYVFPSVETFLNVSYDNEYSKLTFGNDSEIYIGAQPLAEVFDLDNIKIPAAITRIPDYAFYGYEMKSVEIPSMVVEIGKSAFEECCSLTEINLPMSLTEIKERTFNNCSSLQEVKLPETLTKINDYAFNNCSSLQNVEIPAGVKSIGACAFSSCWGLKRITFTGTPDSIGERAFSGISADNIEIPNANKWSRVKFNDTYSNPIASSNQFTVNGTAPKHLVIDIDEHAVSDYAFSGARQLESIKVKASAIGNSSFEDISGVMNLYIDAETLGWNAFYGASMLERIYVPRATPPVATDEVFSKYGKVQLYVPAGAVSSYENAENCWWRFLNVSESDFADISELFAADYSDSVVDKPGSISDIQTDDNSQIDYNAIYEVYTISGIRMNRTIDELTSGIYIVRQGNKIEKISIR